MPDNSLSWSFLLDNTLAAPRLGYYLRETPGFGNYLAQCTCFFCFLNTRIPRVYGLHVVSYDFCAVFEFTVRQYYNRCRSTVKGQYFSSHFSTLHMKCKHADGPTDTTIGPDAYDLLHSHAAEPKTTQLGPVYSSSKCDATDRRYVSTTQLKLLKAVVNMSH